MFAIAASGWIFYANAILTLLALLAGFCGAAHNPGAEALLALFHSRAWVRSVTLGTGALAFFAFVPVLALGQSATRRQVYAFPTGTQLAWVTATVINATFVRIDDTDIVLAALPWTALRVSCALQLFANSIDTLLVGFTVILRQTWVALGSV
jgi:hypothetical protein